MNDKRIDRLYELLPAIYRIRDMERGEPLRALLRVISEQVGAVEDDIARLYENWFIETCDDWVVPYLGDLVGYRPVFEAGEPGAGASARDRARGRILIPRRDVAQTIRNRRRKGALALLEELARDAAGWPARAVEFSMLLARTQHLNHFDPDRGRTCDIRDNDALAQIDGPFDSIAHTVDVRRISSGRTPGRYNIPSVGLFAWRLKPYTVTNATACCIRENCYTFSILGHDTQLFVNPKPETEPTHIAEESNLPAAIRRWEFDAHKENYYGPDKSILIWAQGWGGKDTAGPLPVEAIIPADLSDWSYHPPPDRVAVDPVLGRISFHPGKQPKKGVRVSYVYAFSDDLGGGEYKRPVSQPSNAVLEQVGRNEKVKRIGDAWDLIRKAWDSAPDSPRNGVIEIVDGSVYVEQLNIELGRNEYLQIRAANQVRPVLWLPDCQMDMPDVFCLSLSSGSRVVLDGLLITGRSVTIRDNEGERVCGDLCASEVLIRHCTLVPGWKLTALCEPEQPAEPSLELFNVRARLSIERSIVGSIEISENEVRSDPIPVRIADSIIDSTNCHWEALSGPDRPMAHAVLTILRSTVFGQMLVHAIELAENCIFTNCLGVARRQLGCMRFCYVPSECRTPRRYHCQPDLAVQTKIAELETEAAKSKRKVDESEKEKVRKRERERVRPAFNSMRYGRPDYAQLSELCPEEIRTGADDASEMGAFHDLYNPQRLANLKARLEEYTPAGMAAGVILET